MPNRTDISSILAISALGMLLGACSASNDRAASETAAQCIERFENIGADRLASAMPPDRIVEPVFIYDISRVSDEQKLDLMRAGEDVQGIIVSGDSSKARAEFVSSGTDHRKVTFMSEDAQLLKLRAEPVPQSQINVAGCERTSEGMRLISIHQTFIPPDTPSSPES